MNPSFASVPPVSPDSIWDFAEACLIRTAEILHESQAVPDSEISHGIGVAREAHTAKQPAELLEVICRKKGHEGENLSKAILELGHVVASYVSPYAPNVPFGGKLILPAAFYDKYPVLQKLASALRSPVIFAEDTDAIGTASVNPVATEILAEQIRQQMLALTGIQPFVTIARLDYDSWNFILRKHFDRP
ncbi:MAG: hypothetical protein HC767_14420 [Akkermansiaceae bacterium]|nr:hypothetical protein [Akkermansiaceae bacterium]